MGEITAPPLPLPPAKVPEGHVSINEQAWFVDHDGCINVFRLGIPLFRFARDDTVTLRYVSVQLRIGGHATQSEVAAAFGHSLRSQARWEKDYREGDVEGLRDGKPSGRPRGISPAHRVFLAKWFEQGVGKREIARRLGVSDTTVRRELTRLGLVEVRLEEEDLFEEPEDGESEEAVGGEAKAPVGEKAAEKEGISGPLPPPGTLDTDPLHRVADRFLARFGMINDAVPFFADAESLPRAGVLIAIPLFAATGALSVFQRIYGSLGAAFYGLRTTVLSLFLLALLRIKRPENVKEFSPSELGRIVGLDRMPEVKTLRRKLRRLAAAKKGEELMQALAEERVEQDEERLGYVYVDGHVREYHGKHRLGKAHVTARRISAPAATDTWVNDANGDPLFVVTSELNAGLTKILPQVLEEVKGLSKEGQKTTVVFDRGGYSPKLFAKLEKMGFDLLTYRKGKRDPVPLEEFKDEAVEEDGERKTIRIHDKADVPVGTRKRSKGEEPAVPWLTMRQVSKVRDDGDVTQVLTTRKDLAATEILSGMFSRWIQENYFKYMLAEFALDALSEYGVEGLSDEADRPNPERRKLEKQRAKVKRRLDDLLGRLGEEVEGNEESRRPTVRGLKIANASLRREIAEAAAEMEDLTARIRELPARVKAEGLSQLKRHRKLVVDSIKMLAYQVESELHRMLVGRYARQEDEGRTLLHGIFQSAARIEVGNDELRVTIAPQSSPHKTRVLKELCEELNTFGAKFPGSDLRLVLAADAHEHATV